MKSLQLVCHAWLLQNAKGLGAGERRGSPGLSEGGVWNSEHFRNAGELVTGPRVTWSFAGAISMGSFCAFLPSWDRCPGCWHVGRLKGENEHSVTVLLMLMSHKCLVAV